MKALAFVTLLGGCEVAYRHPVTTFVTVPMVATVGACAAACDGPMVTRIGDGILFGTIASTVAVTAAWLYFVSMWGR